MSNEHNNAPAVFEQELSALLTTSLPYMTPVGRARLGQDIAQLYSSVSAPAVQVYQLAKLGGPTETAWIDVTQEDYEDAGFYKDDFKRRILTATPAPAPAVPQEEGRPGIPLRKAYKHLLIVAPAQEIDKSVADAEIKAMYVESQGSDKGWLGIEGSYFIGGVVAARKQKAAPAPAVPQGEPVAWLDLSKMSASAMVYATGWKSNDKQSPLYATPAATEQAVPSGEVVAWMVYGNYTRQPFGMLCSAEAYMRGLLQSDPDGGYHIRPLRYATPAPAPAVPQGWKLVMVEDGAPANEPDWDEVKRQAEVSTGIPINQPTYSIIIREIRRWLIQRDTAVPSKPAVPMSESQRADMICAVAAICTGTSSRTVAATAIEWVERYYGITTPAATPAPAPAQERCSTCGYLTSEREHLGCLRRAVKDLDIATGGPHDAQEVGLPEGVEAELEELSHIAKGIRIGGVHLLAEQIEAIISALRAKGGKHV